MIQKSEREIREKKEYVSVWLEISPLQRRDVVMASIEDPNADKDQVQGDGIFG